jgi:hypothetical protein
MTIFNYNPPQPRPKDFSLPRILYWSLRGFTFVIALGLGIFIISAFVWVPFYSAEGYTAQFVDRLLGLLSSFLIFIAIIIPHRWTLRGSPFTFRVAMIALSVSSTVVVDFIGYKQGIRTTPFPPSSWLALLVGTALLATLRLEKHRRALPC